MMNRDVIISRLETIRDAYAGIQSISQSVSAASDADDISAAIGRRSELLDKISVLQSGLDRENSEWRKHIGGSGMAADIIMQIKKLLAAIAEKDIAVEEYARARMDSIRKELMSLTTTSKAALAYAGHTDALRLRHAQGR